MKKINLNVEFNLELEVPDHVKLVKVNEDIGELLFVHGKLLLPELDWRALAKITDDGSYEFELTSNEFFKEFHDMIKTIIKEDMRVTTIDDGDKRKRKSQKKKRVSIPDNQ